MNYFSHHPSLFLLVIIDFRNLVVYTDQVRMSSPYIRHRVLEGSGWSFPSPAPRDFSAKPRVAPGPAPASRDLRASPPLKLSPPAPNTTILPARTSKHPTPHLRTAQNQKLPSNMAENELRDLLKQLHQTLQTHNYQQATSLLSRAKVALLKLNALIPSENTSRKYLQAARETLELGAIISIRLKDPVSFTRYFQQLQPFYALPQETLPKDGSQMSKVTGLYLLLLLSDGDYAGFHTLLETLEMQARQAGGKGLEEDVFIQYPIRLEQALMEGSYDRVWGETKSERVPSEEFGMFSEVCLPAVSPSSSRLALACLDV